MNNKKEEKQNEEKRKERERREEKEERKQNRSSEEIELRTPYIEPEQSTIIIPNTTKVQPRKAKMQKYEFEYDETENEE